MEKWLLAQGSSSQKSIALPTVAETLKGQSLLILEQNW
jgi:hypothetical protein